jgi:hypothetical protein
VIKNGDKYNPKQLLKMLPKFNIKSIC